MAKVTGLSGNEIYCLSLKQYSAGELVVGNCVVSMGFLGSIGAGLSNVLGGEVPQVTQAIHEGRAAALDHLARTCERFPHNYSLLQAWIEWLRADGPAAEDAATTSTL